MKYILNIIFITLSIGNIVLSAYEKNYTEALGWFCAFLWCISAGLYQNMYENK